MARPRLHAPGLPLALLAWPSMAAAVMTGNACGCGWIYEDPRGITSSFGHCDVGVPEATARMKALVFGLKGCADGSSESEECLLRRSVAEDPKTSMRDGRDFLVHMKLLFDECLAGNATCAGQAYDWRGVLVKWHLAGRLWFGGEALEWLLAYGEGICRAQYEEAGPGLGRCRAPCRKLGGVCALDRSPLEKSWRDDVVREHCAALQPVRCTEPCRVRAQFGIDACAAPATPPNVNETTVAARAVLWSAVALPAWRCRDVSYYNYAETCKSAARPCDLVEHKAVPAVTVSDAEPAAGHEQLDGGNNVLAFAAAGGAAVVVFLGLVSGVAWRRRRARKLAAARQEEVIELPLKEGGG